LSQIFISYSRHQGREVLLLARKLEEAGHLVWLDTSAIEGGAKWQEEIVRGIEKADVFVIVISPQSIESGNVERELGLAYVRSKPIVPVMLHRVVVPPRLQYALASLEFIDLSEEGVDTGSDRVLNAIASPDVRTQRVYLDRLQRDRLPSYLYVAALTALGFVEWVIQKDHLQWSDSFLIACAIIAALAVWAILAIRRLVINRRLSGSGIVISTELRGFTQLRSQGSCRIASEWRDPLTGKRYEFYSRPIQSDLSEFVGRTIPVIVDPRSFRRYTVDLSFLPKEPSGSLDMATLSMASGPDHDARSRGVDPFDSVFVSYSEQDEKVVDLLVPRLQAAGHTVWAGGGANRGGACRMR
jgi:hypothetical protein